MISLHPKIALLFFFFLVFNRSPAFAQTPAFSQVKTYEQLVQALRSVRKTPQLAEVTEKRVQVLQFWKMGKLINDYALDRGEYARPIVDRLAGDLKEKEQVLYYALQFARTYPDSPPSLDLPWGFYQYLLAINDPEERNEMAERAYRAKWNWDQLRAEVRKITLQNKEFVFTAEPGKIGVYRVVTARKGPYQGELVLDLGFSNYYLPATKSLTGKPEKINFQDYEIVQAECHAAETGAAPACAPHSGGTVTDLFTYQAYVLHVIDGDTFQAVIDLGFGITTSQTLRLWRLNAPEIYTKEGVQAKIFLESSLRGGMLNKAEAISAPILIRSFKMDKYGRYLADVWVPANNRKEYVNQLLIDRGFAKATES